jgi:hypothetical protein
MSLVNQLELTLKDLLPDPRDGKFITDGARGTTITVSNRLYAALRAYADQKRLPLWRVVAQIREEVHAQPIAKPSAVP